MSVSSSKPAGDVAICISDQWNNEVNGVTSRPMAGGFTIALVANGLIYYMADVSSIGTGSSTKYWTGTFTIPHYVSKFGGIVRLCQA
jgi:hypothetical protein